MRWAVLAVGLVACMACTACGPGVAHRPLNITIVNLAADAELLEVSMFSGIEVESCSALAMARPNPAAQSSWQRSSMAERFLELPEIDEDVVVIEVTSKDAQGSLLQFGCRRVEWADLEQPELDIELSPVAAS